MVLFELFFIAFRVVAVFTNFTFTDWEDFAPMATLFIGLICAASIGFSVSKKPSFGLHASLTLLSFWILLPNIGLFFMASEVKKAFGSWPQVMIDDPKNLKGGVSPQYEALFSAVNYLEAFSGAWLILFFTLYFIVKSRLTKRENRFYIGLTLFSLLIYIYDPGNLMAWWID